MSFKKDFAWGVATAAYQIEGAAMDDGRGLSVWDMMCRKPGAIKNGENGIVACDHYHRYKEDVKLMKELGIKAYRMSVSWPRVMPEGMGRINEKGLAFYDKLVDELLAGGITPYITLFHWDFPYELYCRGGWLNPESPDWFARYTEVVVERLGDRVRHWITMNEPQCFIGMGLQDGVHAPGDKLGVREVFRAAHHALVAHGKSVQAIRAVSKGGCKVGYAPVGVVKIPVDTKPETIAAARNVMFGMGERLVSNNTWWMDPIFFGKYPEDGLNMLGKNSPHYTESEMRTIKQEIDFLGLNIYTSVEVAVGSDGKAFQKLPRSSGYPCSTVDWLVMTPEALYWGPKFFYERYKKPIMITENGMCNTDWVSLDGKVHDPQRIDFLHRYLRLLKQAAVEGVPVDGYFIWTLTDNFEWAEGYSKRYGLVYVDFESQKRVLKDSAYWYRDVISSNADNL